MNARAKYRAPTGHYNAIYSPVMVAEVRWLFQEGFTPTFISKMYLCSPDYARQIGKGVARPEIQAQAPAWVNLEEWRAFVPRTLCHRAKEASHAHRRSQAAQV